MEDQSEQVEDESE